MVEFEFEFTYKLCVATQRETLCILKVSELNCRVFMNPQFYADLIVASMFEMLSEDTQRFILSTTSEPAETASTGKAIASKGATPEVLSMEVPTAVPTAPRSPWPKPTPMREVTKPNKDKQKKHVLVRESRRKNATTQGQRKENTSVKGKVVDLEAEELAKYIDIEGGGPYI